MCVEPTTMALTAMAIGTAMSAGSAIQQGQTARKTANMNADAQNATAISVLNQGAQAAADQKLKAKRIEASQIAAAGAGGVSPSSGTPLAIEGETAKFGELDSLRIINNAQRTAWGYQTEAGIQESQGGQAQSASYLNAGSSMLSGASSAYFASRPRI